MITDIGHAAFRCANIEQSIEFFAKLGIVEAFRLNRDDGSVWLVYLRVNDDHFIELFPRGTQGSDDNSARAVGYAHLCLAVDDLEATVADLERKGMPIDVRPKQGRDNNWQAWIVDPDGNRIELMQMVPDSLQNQAIQRMQATTSQT